MKNSGTRWISYVKRSIHHESYPHIFVSNPVHKNSEAVDNPFFKKNGLQNHCE